MKNKTFKELRKNVGLTQSEASKNLGITKIYLSMIENASRKPSDKLKQEMSLLYKVDIAQIFLAIEATKKSKNQ